MSEEVPSPTQATSSQDSFAHATLSPNPPIPTPSSQEPTSQPTAPRKSTSQPAPSRKSVSQQLASQGSTPGALISRAPLPVVIDTPQAGVTSESLSVLGPSQPAVSLSQLVEPSRVPAMPPQASRVLTEDDTVDVQHDLPSASVPSQSLETAVKPKAPYRVRGSAKVTTPGTRSRQGSIDGAPEVIYSLRAVSETRDLFNNGEPEVIVDLREFINVDTFVSLYDDGKAESHVSSSQKTADGSGELPTPSQNPPTLEKVTNPPQSAPTRTPPHMDVDVDDLPAWMVKRGQWKYLVSTTGGPLWERLLRIYMQQERRLDFTETVCDLTHNSPFQH